MNKPTAILVLNGGSSSIKFSAWDIKDESGQLLEGEIEDIGTEGTSSAKFWIKSWLNGSNGEKVLDEKPQIKDTSAAFKTISEALSKLGLSKPAAIGHRMVCGGPTVTEHQRITPQLIEEMERYTSFAQLK